MRAKTYSSEDSNSDTFIIPLGDYSTVMIIYKQNNSQYEGESQAGCRHGFGKLKFLNSGAQVLGRWHRNTTVTRDNVHKIKMSKNNMNMNIDNKEQGESTTTTAVATAVEEEDGVNWTINYDSKSVYYGEIKTIRGKRVVDLADFVRDGLGDWRKIFI